MLLLLWESHFLKLSIRRGRRWECLLLEATLFLAGDLNLFGPAERYELESLSWAKACVTATSPENISCGEECHNPAEVVIRATIAIFLI